MNFSTPRSRRAVGLTLGAALTLGGVAVAQVLGPEFTDDYTLADLGPVPGLPPRLGGITLKFDDPNTLIAGGNASGPFGVFYSIGVVRDAENHIVGYSGTAQYYCDGPNNDGGLLFMPNGTLLYTRYNTNQIGQILPGSTTVSRVIDLSPLGVHRSVGGLAVVPARLPGAGRMKVTSYNVHRWYDVEFSPAGDGTFDITAAAWIESFASTLENVVYVPPCSPGFFEPSLLLCEYGLGRISAYGLTATGDPVLSTRRDFVTGLLGAEGSFIDPITGDFFFGTYSQGNRIVAVRGFEKPDKCLIDINADCFVSGDDFDVFVGYFVDGDLRADFNADGFVNGDDFDAFSAQYVEGC